MFDRFKFLTLDMELLLNYQNDKNNGLSIIENFTEQHVASWGTMAMTNKFAIIPLKLNITNGDRAFSYRYNFDVDNWVFHQIITFPTCDGYPTIAAVSESYMIIFSPVMRSCYVYTLNEFEQWGLIQTLPVPPEYEGPYYSGYISAYDDYFIFSDWNYYSTTTLRWGIVMVYQWNPITQQFVETDTILPIHNGSNRFGDKAIIRNGHIFIGAWRLGGTNDGAVYIYEFNGTDWINVQNIYGTETGGYLGEYLDAYVEAPDRLIIGARGVDSYKGRVYIYHKIVGTWTLNTTIDEPPAYQAVDNEFGARLGIWGDQACIRAGGSHGAQYVVYCYKYNGATWELDVKSDGVSDARFFDAGGEKYGVQISQTPQTVLSVTENGNCMFISRRAAGWVDYPFIYFDNVYLKNTIDESFYHLASGNQQIVFKLTTPIVGRFSVVLEIDNMLETIGSQNDKIYFYENGVYKIAILTHATYDGAALAAHVRSRMNTESMWPNNYYVEYNAGSNKFTVSSKYPFAFGSNNASSIIDSCQNKTLGFYDNELSLVHIYYASDRIARLGSPSQIGVNITESYSTAPKRNNNPFVEVGLIATLDTGDDKYKISESSNQIVRFKKKVNELTFTFPCLEGGALLDINTNNITVRLIDVD